MNNINWSTAALAIVLGFCIVSFNDRLSSLSSLNEKVSDLLQENAELHSIDGMMARSLQNKDIEKKVKRNKRKIEQNKQAVEANADVIGMIVDGSPSIAAGLVCPTGTFMLPHFGTTTSSESCHSGAINAEPGKCIKAFLIANGKEVGCNEKIDDSGTSRTNIVDACCKVTTVCPVGTKVKHYGSTSSDAYCLSGPTLDEKGSICTAAFLMPGGKPYPCSDVYDTSSRTDTVEACCKPDPCPTNSVLKEHDGNLSSMDYCYANGRKACVIANEISTGREIGCYDEIGTGSTDELVETCCATPYACIDGMFGDYHDGSIATDGMCTNPGSDCAYGVLLSDGSRIDCDTIVDPSGSTYVQTCCYP